MSTQSYLIPDPQFDAAVEPPRKRYRAVTVPAVVSVICGAASITLFFHWLLVLLPLLGLFCGWLALKRTARTTAELTGGGLALTGIGLSLFLGGVGGGLLLFTGRFEVPFGYRVVTWDELQTDPNRPADLIPPAIEKLEKEKVFVRGYMYPGRQVIGLRSFVLVPTEGHCNFCTRQLRSSEMIMVVMAGDLRADYTSKLARVGGRLRLDREQAMNPYGGFPYIIECDHFR